MVDPSGRRYRALPGGPGGSRACRAPQAARVSRSAFRTPLLDDRPHWPSDGTAQPGRSRDVPGLGRPGALQRRVVHVERPIASPLATGIAAVAGALGRGTAGRLRTSSSATREEGRMRSPACPVRPGRCAAVGWDDVGLCGGRGDDFYERPGTRILGGRALVAAARSQSCLRERWRQSGGLQPERRLMHVAAGVHCGRHRRLPVGRTALVDPTGTNRRRRTRWSVLHLCQRLHSGRLRRL